MIYAFILLAASVAFLIWEARRAPDCPCGRRDCGGGCLK